MDKDLSPFYFIDDAIWFEMDLKKANDANSLQLWRMMPTLRQLLEASYFLTQLLKHILSTFPAIMLENVLVEVEDVVFGFLKKQCLVLQSRSSIRDSSSLNAFFAVL